MKDNNTIGMGKTMGEFITPPFETEVKISKLKGEEKVSIWYSAFKKMKELMIGKKSKRLEE